MNPSRLFLQVFKCCPSAYQCRSIGRTCSAVLIGLFLFLTGTALSILGYYDTTIATEFRLDHIKPGQLVKQQQQQQQQQQHHHRHHHHHRKEKPQQKWYFEPEPKPNRTMQVTPVLNHQTYVLVKSMAYIGPLIMALGAFMLMMMCVRTLELRDQRSKIRRRAAICAQTPFENLQLLHADNSPRKAERGSVLTLQPIDRKVSVQKKLSRSGTSGSSLKQSYYAKRRNNTDTPEDEKLFIPVRSSIHVQRTSLKPYLESAL